MTFEEIFKIPNRHKLKQISFEQKGSLAQNEYWVHEEIDENNKVIAKYESWHCVDPYKADRTSCGYKK